MKTKERRLGSKKNLCLFLLLSCWFNLTAQIEQLTIIELPDSTLNIRPHLQIFTDESNKMNWEEIYTQKELGNFAPFETYSFKSILERGKYDYWFYFSIDFKSDRAEKIIIRKFGSGGLICHQLKEGKLIYQRKAGNSYQNDDSHSSFAYLKNDLPITLQPGLNEFLVFKRPRPSYYPQNTQPVLVKEMVAIAKEDKYLLLFFATNGFFFGILAFVILYSIVQYFQVRDRAFLFYALYIASLFLYFLRYFSVASQYFYFLPPWAMHYQQHNLFNYPVFITYMIFLRVFLDTPNKLPKLERIIRIALGLIISYFLVHRVLLYINLNGAYQMDNYVRITYLVLGIAALFTLFKHQNKLVKYVLAGTFSLIFLTLIGLILIYEDDHYWLWWEKANSMAQIGALLELFCFSMGLGYKTQLIEKERNQVRNDLELKQQEARQLKKLDIFKDRFYTNITHEFRTPLTVIQGVAQQIKENPNQELDKRTSLIRNNADNLLNLVNQLLDLSKVELGQLKLNYVQQDLIKYVSYLTESFHSLAYSKKINLSFYSNLEGQLMDFDREGIKSIMTNLISNALKFTPEYGKINVVADLQSVAEVETELLKEATSNGFVLSVKNKTDLLQSENPSNYIRIKIKDSGIGIATEQLPSIFDRFYQSDNSDKKATEGTGIGLALVKELVLLMKGQIWVKSTLKKGSTFTIILPITNNAPLETDRLEIAVAVPPKKTDVKTNADLSTVTEVSQTDKPVLLIIEDNQDVVYYLKSCLDSAYQILEANNGLEGRDLAIEHIPDIILSDVMMPEMDGYELCEFLKKDARTSHIPIVLLTAKATQENRKTGLTSGADAYLIKPFDKKELLLQLENLVLLKKHLQLYLQLKNQKGTINKSVISPVAEKELIFLQQLETTVIQHLDDELFKAPQLAKAMAMSDTQLYRKIKALTNYSTAQYIRTIRLERAKNLLGTTDYSIGRISLEVGFKNQSHFSKTFQNEYGILPSEMRK